MITHLLGHLGTGEGEDGGGGSGRSHPHRVGSFRAFYHDH